MFVRGISKRFWVFMDGDSGDSGAGAPASSEGAPVGDSSQSAAPASGGLDWGTVVPSEYKDKPYFQQILKSQDPTSEFFKQFDNAQQLIGKKSGVPGADASDEDWENYYKTTRPGTADEYDFKPIGLDELSDEDKPIAEYINKNRNDDFIKGVKEDLYAEGLTKRQAERVAAKYDKRLMEAYKGQFKAEAEKETALENDFISLRNNVFGGDSQKAQSLGEAFVQKHVPPEIRKHLGSFDNKALMVFAAAAMSVNKMYEKEDSVITSGASSTQAKSSEELVKQQQELMATDAWRSKLHEGHKQVDDQVRALTNAIIEARKREAAGR